MALSAQARTLLAATTASFLTPFMGSSVVVALAAIASELRMNAISLSWVATGFLLSAAIFLVPFGRISDLYGRRKVFLVGVGVFTLASGLTALAPTGQVLILMRIFHGFASAMIFSTAMAMVSASAGSGQRGRALGINVAAVYLGLSLGPPVGGLLTEYLGWRSLFIVAAALGVGAFWVARGAQVVESRPEGNPKVDWAGCVLYGVSLAGCMTGLSLLPAVTGAILLMGGGIVGAAFLRWETRTQDPILDVKLFLKNRLFAFSNLAALIHYSATFAVGFLLSLYLQVQRGMSPRQAGSILLIQPAIMALLSPFSGSFSDRVEPRVLASIGMGVTVVGLLLMSRLGPQTHLFQIVASLVILGGGYALFSSPNANSVMGSVDKGMYGLASATLGTMRLLGHMMSMAVLTLILALVMGRAALGPETAPLLLRSMRISLSCFAFMGLLGTFASMARGRGQPRGESGR